MNGVGAGARGDVRTWSIGLVNASGHYLTAESFGCKINASAVSMKKKQLWTLEHVDNVSDVEVDVVFLKSHLGRYLSCDKKGNTKCEEDNRSSTDTQFVIDYCPSSGRWAFRSKLHGLFFGGQEDFLKCDTKMEWWTVRLAVHPHVNIKNINRKKYAFLDAEADQIHVDKVIPWGPESLITVEFREREGKYAVKASNNKYLDYDGNLTPDPAPNCLFNVEVKSNQSSGLALKATDGRYLSAEGRPPVMKCKTKKTGTVSKDEIFTLEDSHAQVYITSHNGRKVSTKQGVDLSANQDEVTDKEIFQVEFDKAEKGWRLRTSDDKYWSLEQAQGIQARSATKGQNGIFYIEWQKGSGQAAIKASNNKYVTAKMNGSLLATQVEPTEKEMFCINVINRPVLILRCEHGFVGMKAQTSTRVECNKSTYDSLFLELSGNDDGIYHMKGPNGKYLRPDASGLLSAESAEPYRFVFEISSQSKFRIRDENGQYLMGEANGTMKFGGSKITEWEY